MGIMAVGIFSKLHACFTSHSDVPLIGIRN